MTKEILEVRIDGEERLLDHIGTTQIHNTIFKPSSYTPWKSSISRTVPSFHCPQMLSNICRRHVSFHHSHTPTFLGQEKLHLLHVQIAIFQNWCQVLVFQTIGKNYSRQTLDMHLTLLQGKAKISNPKSAYRP